MSHFRTPLFRDLLIQVEVVNGLGTHEAKYIGKVALSGLGLKHTLRGAGCFFFSRT